MDEQGKTANAAFLVSAASLLAAHVGFAFSTEPQLLGALIGAKVSGGIAAVAAVVFVYAKKAVGCKIKCDKGN